MARLRLAALSSIVLTVFIASAIFPLSARADEATPPPPDNGEVVGTDSAPPADATEPAPADVAPPTEAAEVIPVDPAATEPAPEEAAPIDVATALPEGTDLMVLDSTGAAEPLATVEAAEIIASGDPIWCPGLPGDGGCSASYTDLALLLTDLTTNQPNQDGTIWIQAGVDASGPFVLDGSTLTTWSEHSLRIQGGWDLSGTGNISGTTTFDGSLRILNWDADISINDVIFDLAPENQPDSGLEVTTNGAIDLDNVVSSGNAFAGADLEGDERVGVRHSTFNDNGLIGLDVKSLGDIVVEDTEASGNGEDADPESDFGMGAWLDNQWDEATGTINVTRGVFNDNYTQGLVAFSLEDISIVDTDASGNGSTSESYEMLDMGAGIALDNCASGWFFGACAGSGDIYVQGGTFEHNYAAGLGAESAGSITVQDIVAQENGNPFGFDELSTGVGAVLLDLGEGPEASIAVTGSSFNSNFGYGLAVMSNGDVTVTNSEANCNGGFCGIRSDVSLQLVVPVPMADGIMILTSGDINLSNVQLNDNTAYGAELSAFDDLSTTAAIDGGLGGDFLPVPFALGGNVFLNNVTANGNGFDGVAVAATGNVAVASSQANENGWLGLDGFDGGVIPLVDIVEYGNGFSIEAAGDITLNSVMMNGNTGFGAELYSFPDSGSDFGGAGLSLLPAPSEGNISLSGVNAVGNGWGGANIFTVGRVLVDRSNFSGNIGFGLAVTGLGGVSIYDSTFSGNTASGLSVISAADSLVQCSTFENNGGGVSPGYGVFAVPLPGTTLTLAGNTFSGNAMGDYLDIIGEPGVVVVEGDCGSAEREKQPAGLGGLPWNIVNVTQPEQVGLDCAAYVGTALVLPNGDHALLPCPIQDQGTLSGKTADNLPGPLDEGLTFLSGVEVGLTNNGQAVDPLNATLQVHFAIPEGQQGSQLSILHWNGTEWQQLDGVVSADGFFEAPYDGIGVFVLVSG